MEKNIRVIRALSDPKDGRLVVHYKLNGGEEQKIEFAAFVSFLEEELHQHINGARHFFEYSLTNLLKLSAEGAENPAVTYGHLMDSREDTNLALDLARLTEINFQIHGFRDNPKGFEDALEQIVCRDEVSGNYS